MVILESGIIHEGKLLVKKQFYPSDEFLSDQTRTDLLSSVFHLADKGFHDNLHKIAVGKNYILTVINRIDTKISAFENRNIILTYSITDSETNEKAIINEMKNTANMFLDRYSIVDIVEGNPKKFRKFEERLENNFQDLALKLEDRFKALY